MIRRLLPHPGLAAVLVVMGIVIAGDLTFAALFLALVLGVAVPIFTAPWWPSRPKMRFLPACRYAWLVLGDIVVANVQVAGIVLFRRAHDLHPAWLTVPLELSTPEAITVFASTISLTPGTVSADVSACGRFLLVHALHAPDPAAEIAKVKARYEALLKEVFP
jgi:multicomponent K+:H+ antiporter subunit E